MLLFTNSNLWDIQIDINETFLDLFDILDARIGFLIAAVCIIFIWLVVITCYILISKQKVK